MAYANLNPFAPIESRCKLTAFVHNSTRCLPLVTPDAILIAVCGANEYLEAGIAGDGLRSQVCEEGVLQQPFLRLLSAPPPPERHGQTTALADLRRPHRLVDQYQAYAHGTEDRRVVLGRDVLKELSDISVYEPQDLLPVLLSQVALAGKATEGTGRPVLLLIFGHGEPVTQ